MLQLKDYSAQFRSEQLSESLIDGLKSELYLTPKPGLVDLKNSGSHGDLTLQGMSWSIALLHLYLAELRALLDRGAELDVLIGCGQKAEQRMFSATGTNCHKGGIFLCGLFLVAAYRCQTPWDQNRFRMEIACVASEFFRVRTAADTHGSRVRQQRPESGIVAETLNGLPSLFDVFLPAMLDDTVDQHWRPFLGMAVLMQVVDDSTSLHRCGPEGLSLVRSSGAHIESVIRKGLNPYPLLEGLDLQFQTLGLTMGGVADLLGVGLGYLDFISRWNFLSNVSGRKRSLLR